MDNSADPEEEQPPKRQESAKSPPPPPPLHVPAAQEEEKEEGIPLLYYWQVILKHKWKVVSVAFLVVLATAIHLSKLVPLYQASATLLIEQSKAKVVSIENVYSSDYGQSYMQTQIELLRSRHLVEAVVRQERLDLAPEFNPKTQEKRRGWTRENWIPKWMQAYLPPAPDPEPNSPTEPKKPGFNSLHFASLVDKITGQIKVSPIGTSQLVRVSFISESPELAARVATAVAQVYIDQTLEARLQMTQNAASWLMKRLSGLRQGLEESERKLQDYRESSGLLGSLEKESMESQQLSSLNGTWMLAQKQKTETQIRYERFQALMKEYKNHLEDLSLKDNPMVDNLNTRCSSFLMLDT